MIGDFYRIRKNRRGVNENLNAPGMDFIPMAFDCVCNAPASTNNSMNRFYIYDVIVRLAALAAARELALLKGRQMNVAYYGSLFILSMSGKIRVLLFF